MLYPRPESAQSISAFPGYQFEHCYQVGDTIRHMYAVSPLLIDGTMPFVIVRVDTEHGKDPQKIRPFRFVEYQYGLIPTNYANCYEVDNDEEMAEAIECTLTNFVEARAPLFKLYMRKSSRGVPELKIKRQDFRSMEKGEGSFWLQTFVELSGKISEIIEIDRERIENRVYSAIADPLAVKKYKQATV